jgi:hypothetical protein
LNIRNGDKDMTQNTEKRITMDSIRIRTQEQINELGKIYHDEVVKYLITGEAVAKTDSEKKLVNDIKYLLTKVSLLERMYVDDVRELEDTIDNKFRQTTIEESLGMETDKIDKIDMEKSK